MKCNIKFLFICFFIHTTAVFSTLEKNSNVSFGKAAFINSRIFFLGASQVGALNNAVSNVRLVQEEDELPEIVIDELTPPSSFINADTETRAKGDAGKGSNPVYNKSITFLSTMASQPVVVIGQQDGDLTANNKICLIQSSESVVTTTEKLKDADGAVGNGISGIAGATNHIFAAVKPSGSNFGGENSGLTLVTTASNQLVTVDATTGTEGGNKSVKFDMASDVLMAIGATSFMDNIIDMYWDSTLGRLFVSLRVRRSDSTADGGVIALFVARIDDSDGSNLNKILLEPCVSLNSSNFITDSDNHIFGFYRNAGGGDVFSSLYKSRSLHTSTGNSYLIINGSVSTGDVKNKVFAVPIVKQIYTDGVISNKADVGKVADKSNFAITASGTAKMTLATDLSAIVGGGDLPSGTADDINVLFTSGDAVIVGLSGSTVDKSGFFISTALFNSQGKIARWTPWQRVMGSTGAVLGGGFDPNASLIADTTKALYMYLTNDSSGNPTTVKLTQWGKDPSGSLGLGELIENEFPRDQGGTFSFFDFDESTPSFKAGDDNLGLMVATGYKKIMLIETGSRVAGGVFTPNSGDFTTGKLSSTDGSSPAGSAGSKTMVISGGVLDDIGPLSMADVSRVDAAIGADDRGYLFVAGRNGVVVLSEADGTGWDAAEVGLKRGFVGITSTMSFKQLGTFSNIRKIVCDDEYVYVLTSSALYRMSLSTTANFSTVGASSPTFTTIATLTAVTGNSNSVFYDLVVSSKIALLATSDGLFRVGDLKEIKTVTGASDANWTEVLIAIGTNNLSLGLIKQLDLASAIKGTSFAGGMLYVLVSDPAYNLASVFRFNLADTRTVTVSGSSISLVTEPNDIVYFMALGRHRLFFRTDGTVVFHQSPQHFGNTDFLHFVGVRENITINTHRGFPIDLEVGEGSDKNIGLLVRNSASGSWMVPGDFGLRINQ